MRLLLLVAIMASSCVVMAQNQLSLDNLDEFKTQAGNWQIVGDVTMNRHVDTHPAPAKEESKKKKKKKKSADEKVEAVTFTPGTGVLLNINTEDKKSHLITNWEHGDIELEFEVMLPKGSNSGLYLQGRYEVQLYDSWGVKNPKFSDIGGVYRNWSKEPGKIMIGIPPASNPAKAPGLWQKLKIAFRAPRFDENGNKIQNARLEKVELNGVRIHTNVDLFAPTGGPISQQEAAMGPIMIQGDHGPVAIRNFTYKLISESKVSVENLTYKSFEGEFKEVSEFASATPKWSGDAKNIDINLAGNEDNYGVVFSGTLVVPTSGTYTFRVGHTGGVKFELNNKVVVENKHYAAQGMLTETVELNAGKYPFTLSNFKSAQWRAPRLGLYVQGEATHRKAFHHYDSYPEQGSSRGPIFVDAESEPRMLRGFVSFAGNGPKLSHTIGVGTPQGMNYVFDLNSANLIGAWRGKFVDATPMWANRGNATFVPRGAVQWTFLNQPLAQLSSQNSPFPEKPAQSDFTPKGYSIDKTTGLPVFKHIYKGVEVKNFVQPDPSNTYVVNEVTFSQSGLSGWYYKLAEGKEVEKMVDGSYAVDGKQYYVNVLSAQQPFVRTIDGKQELVLPVDGSTIKYELIW